MQLMISLLKLFRQESIKSQLENSTMHALAISIDLNKVFDYYTKAFQASVSEMNNSGHKGMNMQVMNNHV